MKSKINENSVTLARESRGISQTELANKINVTQGTISKIENGVLVTDELVRKLADTLNYPEEFFYQNAEMYPPGINFYRKHKTLSKKTLDQIAAKIDIQRLHLQKLLQSAEVYSDNDTNILEWKDFQSPEEAAQMVREYWRIPRGEIEDLTEYVEGAGVIVIPRDFGTHKFSACSKYTNKFQYVIFINDRMPADRYRFTLANELGHILMHRISTPEGEKEADAFAAELLMPKNDIKKYLYKPTFSKLAALKRKWKVSMGALIERAYDLETITKRQRRYMWAKMAKLGYKRREPPELDFPKEEPKLLNQLITLHFRKLDYSITELSNFLKLESWECEELYNMEYEREVERKLRVIK